MNKNNKNAKKNFINIDKIYKTDFNLFKTIVQTRKIRHNNKTLEVHKKNLKELMKEINSQFKNNNFSTKNLTEKNANFFEEYRQFNQKKEIKKGKAIIFKDLMELYKSNGYRIPNFSINSHNIFKFNPLLEENIDIISNGFLESRISSKNDETEKIIKYLKKLGIILSGKIAYKGLNLQKNLAKKLNLPKMINKEDNVEILKKKIKKLKRLIKTNALSKIDGSRRFNISRRNSFASLNFFSNQNIFLLNKDKNSRRRASFFNNGKTIKIEENKEKNPPLWRKYSKDSSLRSNNSIINNKNFFDKKINSQSTEKLKLKVNFTSNINSDSIAKHSLSPKVLNIPVINFQRINVKKKTNESDLISLEEKKVSNFTNNLSYKQNNIFNFNKMNEEINSQKTINNYNYESQSGHTSRNHNKNQYFIQTSSNESNKSNFSDEIFFELKSSKGRNKNNISSIKRKKRKFSPKYPYTSRNEFINFAFNRFSKRSIKNSDLYIKNYLTKVEGYDNEKIERFVNNILDKNIKSNIKELEKQITSRDLYSKTERLYLNSHLIKRIKPMLNNMEERDKMIYRLEKNLTKATNNK